MPASSEKKEQQKKIFVYFSSIMLILMIFTGWLINLKNNFDSPQTTGENQLTDDIKKISDDFNKIILETHLQKESAASLSSPPDIDSSLQNALDITPGQLSSVIEKIKIETATSTPTSTSIIF